MSWKQFATADPALAQRVWAPFAVQRHAVMGSIRRDGSPRLSGVEPNIVDDELLLSFMTHSRKAADLLRDPRFALHNSTTVTDFDKAGDARLSGTAELVTDSGVRSRYAEWLRAKIDFDPSEGGFDLFRAELTEALIIVSTGSELIIDTWTPTHGTRQHRRS